MLGHERNQKNADNQQDPRMAPDHSDNRVTRRQALRKFGLTTSIAMLTLLSVDDLAHAMQQRVRSSKALDSHRFTVPSGSLSGVSSL